MAKTAKKTAGNKRPSRQKDARPKGARPKDGSAEALFAAAMARYGDRLDAKQVKTLRATARDLANAAATLKAFELANGEEPVAAFAVIDEER